jgi:Tfp pilus assembly protein PilX
MSPTPRSRLPGTGFARVRRHRGFALIITLLLLGAMSVLVMSQISRNLGTHNISVNSSRYLQAETAAQTVLRFCEAAMLTSVGEADSVRVTTPGTRGVDPPAWRDADKWANAGVTFGATAVALPGVTQYECLFEDASADLVPSQLANDVSSESGPVGGMCAIAAGNSPRLCKYRMTARVTLQGGAQFLLQSEIRFAI